MEMQQRCKRNKLGSELDGSEMPSSVQHKKMSRNSFEQKELNVDHMEHYKSIHSELLLKKDGASKGISSTKTQNKDKRGDALKGSSPLFIDQINGLEENDKKTLKHTLNEITTYLNAEVDKVDQDVQAMVQSGEIRQENAKELSAGLLGKLGKMAQIAQDTENAAVSIYRPMTNEEKIELGKRIRKLPEEALNRAVEIIKAAKPESQSSEKITMNLEELDDAILWRLYYHVDFVLNESNYDPQSSPIDSQ